MTTVARSQCAGVMEIIWVKSKWTVEDLDHKTVEFRLPFKNGIVHGLGEFWVRHNPQGMLAVEVVTDQQGRNWAERVQTRYFLPQIAVDRIDRHPDPSVAAFRLV